MIPTSAPTSPWALNLFTDDSALAGALDEVKIYDRLLSTQSIANLYNGGTPGNGTLDGSDTVVNSTYVVVATPNDQKTDGLSKTSNAVVVQNAPPTCTDTTLTIDEDGQYDFVESDFPYEDDEGAPLVKIRITAGTSAGALTSSGVTLNADDEVASGSLDTLTFAPSPDANGTPYATFSYKVNDGTEFSTSACTVTLNVTPVNDLPTSSDPALMTNPAGDATTTADLIQVPSNLGDVDGQTVVPVFDWQADGTSLAVLNMPFDNEPGGGAGEVEDYSTHGNHGTLQEGAVWHATACAAGPSLLMALTTGLRFPAI